MMIAVVNVQVAISSKEHSGGNTTLKGIYPSQSRIIGPSCELLSQVSSLLAESARCGLVFKLGERE
jgi:hypothetical protein